MTTTTRVDASDFARGVAENGRVLATLDDWRAIMFLLVLIVLVLAVLVGWVLRSARLEREKLQEDMRLEREKMREDMQIERNKMYEVADKFTAAADRIVDQAGRLTTELQVLRAVSSRVEATTGSHD